MEIQISIENPQKALALLEFLKSLDYVEIVKIYPDLSINNTTQNRFEKYNDIWKNKISTSEIDEQLTLLRNEWERRF